MAFLSRIMYVNLKEWCNGIDFSSLSFDEKVETLKEVPCVGVVPEVIYNVFSPSEAQKAYDDIGFDFDSPLLSYAIALHLDDEKIYEFFVACEENNNMYWIPNSAMIKLLLNIKSEEILYKILPASIEEFHDWPPISANFERCLMNVENMDFSNRSLTRYCCKVMSLLSSDENKIYFYNKVCPLLDKKELKDSYGFNYSFVLHLEKYENIKKYLPLLDREEQFAVIGSIDDELVARQFFNEFHGKRRLVALSCLNDDNEIIKQLDRVGCSLHGDLISAMKDEDLRYQYFCKKLRKLKKDDNDIDRIFKSLSSEHKDEFFKNNDFFLLKYSTTTFNNYIKELNLSNDELKKYVWYVKLLVGPNSDSVKCDFCEELDDEIKLQIVPFVMSSYKRIELLTTFEDVRLAASQLKHISKSNFESFENDILIVAFYIINNKFEKVTKILEHYEASDYDDGILQFKDDLINLYSNNLSLNKEHLIKYVDTFGMTVFTNLHNDDNLKKIINLDDERFNKIMSLFMLGNKTVHVASILSSVESILNREFIVNQSTKYNIFSLINTAVNSREKEEAIQLLKLIYPSLFIKYFELNNDLDKYMIDDDINYDAIYEGIINNQIPYLHDITYDYITDEKNKYIKDNLVDKLYSMGLYKKYNKNSCINILFKKYDLSIIVAFIKENLEMYGNPEVSRIVNDEEYLKRIISFKKQANSVSVGDDEKKSFFADMKILVKYLEVLYENDLIDIAVSKNDDNFEYYFRKNKYYGNNVISEIITEMNLECFLDNVLSDEKLYNELLEYLEKYSLLSVCNDLSNICENADLEFDSFSLASLISNFYLISPKLDEYTKTTGRKINMPLLMEQAELFSKSSSLFKIIFGKEDSRYLLSNPGPNRSSMKRKKRMDEAIDYYIACLKREYITIEPFDEDFKLKSGNSLNVNIGNFTDPINLTYGERTGACMRIGGAGSSLFDFCLCNDNGFHLRISLPNGKFVSRVSGFRNGNTVFLNQLRNSVVPNVSDVEVVEACQMAALKIIEDSKDSPYPIDNVVISKDMAMKSSSKAFDLPSIKCSGITKGFKDFYVDVGGNNCYVLATTAKSKEDIYFKYSHNKIPYYSVLRVKPKLSKSPMIDLMTFYAKEELLRGKKIDEIEGEFSNVYHFNEIDACYIGEDWYIVYEGDGNIIKYVSDTSKNKEQAQVEIDKCISLVEGKERNMTI